MSSSSFTLHFQHKGTLMPLPYAVPAESRRPFEDGYRTPMVEDPEHRAYTRSVCKTSDDSVSQFFQNLRNGPFRQDRNVNDDQRSTRPRDSNESVDRSQHLSWKERVRHVTWAYFTITMATGGIANVLLSVPYQFHGLRTIGTIFFLLNISLYIAVWALIITRFYLYPQTFKASFTHPTESLFVPAFAVSFGTILINIVEYGFGKVGIWLNQTILVLFWFDATLAVILSITIYLVLWSTQSFTIARMTPIWIFPAYPLLIIGPHAANLSARIPEPSAALTVIIGGFTIQGIGFLVAMTIYSAFVYRLMTQKLPPEGLRPGMFVSVGPSAFTVSGTVGMAANVRKNVPADYMGNGPLTAQILEVVGNWMSLWLWGLALWFFFVSVGSHYSIVLYRSHRRDFHFAMTWFSFIFPQTALCTATFAIGKAFRVPAIQILGCVMTCVLILAWGFVVYMMIRAVIIKHIMWPDQGEDKAEGGFKVADEEKNGRQIRETLGEDVRRV